MSTTLVSSEGDLLRELLGLNGTDFPDLKFAGFPRMVIDAVDGIDIMRNTGRLGRIQTAVHRQYCWIKYGTRSSRRLREPEREALHVPATPLLDGKRLVLDFTNAANAMLAAVKERVWKASSWKPGPDLLPEVAKHGGPLAAMGVAAVWNMEPEQLERILTKAAFGCILVLALGVYLDDARVPERLASQERMKALDRTTIVQLDGTRATPTDAVERALKAEKEADERKLQLLSDLKLEHPLVGFVVAEAEQVRPLVLGLAPKTGTTSFNGREMPAQAIRAWAKQLQRASLDNRRSGGGWITKVKKEPEDI